MELSLVQKIAIYLLPLILAITVHESAHGFIAYKYGDDTAKRLGRLTLNPIPHIDLFGTILFPLLSLVLGINFLFGWAKPVPINYNRLINPKKNLLLVSLAGPISNIAMSLIWVLIFKYSIYLPSYFSFPLLYMAQAGVSINISLFLINILPILPLDGGRALFSVLPEQTAYKYAKSERYGLLILMALIFSGVLSHIFNPIFYWIYQFMISL